MKRHRLILALAFLATFATGWIASRSWNAPVAGTLPDEIPNDLMTKMQVRKTLVLSDMPADQIIVRIGQEWGVPTVLDQANLHMDVSRPIDLEVSNGTLIDAIADLKFNFDFDATVTDGVVRFGSNARIGQMRVLRVYHIGDLIDRIIDRGIERNESRATDWIVEDLRNYDVHPEAGTRVLWRFATAFEHQVITDRLNALANSTELRR